MRKLTLRGLAIALVVPIGCLAGMSSTPAQAAGLPFSAPAPAADPALFNDCQGVIVSPHNLDYENQVVVLVNQQRAAQGLPPLKQVNELENAARAHTEDMGVENYLTHNSQNPTCVWSERVNVYYPGWNSLGENIAGGYADPQSVMNGWMNSEGHRDNILDADFCEIGVGYAPFGQYGTTWTQDFGCRMIISHVYPLVINGEAPTTTNPTVSLYIYGSWSEIRLRNDDGSWSAWMPFHNSMSWQLSGQPGDHTVYAEMRGSQGTASASDTIHLNPPVHYTDFLYLPLIFSQ